MPYDLGPFYQALFPWVEALARVVAGLAMVPHGLRSFYGLFPSPRGRVGDFAHTAEALEASGFRPGRLWAGYMFVCHLIAGPLLALGLFTRVCAVLLTLLLAGVAVDRARDGWFWSSRGAEYAVMWAALMLLFVVLGGGEISLDQWLFR